MDQDTVREVLAIGDGTEFQNRVNLNDLSGPLELIAMLAFAFAISSLRRRNLSLSSLCHTLAMAGLVTVVGHFLEEHALGVHMLQRLLYEGFQALGRGNGSPARPRGMLMSLLGGLWELSGVIAACGAVLYSRLYKCGSSEDDPTCVSSPIHVHGGGAEDAHSHRSCRTLRLRLYAPTFVTWFCGIVFALGVRFNSILGGSAIRPRNNKHYFFLVLQSGPMVACALVGATVSVLLYAELLHAETHPRATRMVRELVHEIESASAKATKSVPESSHAHRAAHVPGHAHAHAHNHGAAAPQQAPHTQPLQHSQSPILTHSPAQAPRNPQFWADSKLAQSVEAQALAWARRRESDLQTTIADQLRASTPRSHTHQHAHMASASMPLLSTPPKHPTAPPQSTRSARSTRFNQYGVNVERGDGDVSHLISSDSDSDNDGSSRMTKLRERSFSSFQYQDPQPQGMVDPRSSSRYDSTHADHFSDDDAQAPQYPPGQHPQPYRRLDRRGSSLETLSTADLHSPAFARTHSTATASSLSSATSPTHPPATTASRELSHSFDDVYLTEATSGSGHARGAGVTYPHALRASDPNPVAMRHEHEQGRGDLVHSDESSLGSEYSSEEEEDVTSVNGTARGRENAAPPTRRPSSQSLSSLVDVGGENGSWKQYVDKSSGAKYWFNEDTGESSWHKPEAVRATAATTATAAAAGPSLSATSTPVLAAVAGPLATTTASAPITASSG